MVELRERCLKLLLLESSCIFGKLLEACPDGWCLPCLTKSLQQRCRQPLCYPAAQVKGVCVIYSFAYIQRFSAKHNVCNILHA